MKENTKYNRQDDLFQEAKENQIFTMMDLKQLEKYSVVNRHAKISHQTMLIIDKVDADNQCLLVNVNEPPFLVSSSSRKLIKECDRYRLFGQQSLSYMSRKVLGKDHKNLPYINGRGIFVPLNSSIRGKTMWYNLFFVEHFEKHIPNEYTTKETIIHFKDQLQLKVPLGFAAINERVKLHLFLGRIYFFKQNGSLIAEGLEATDLENVVEQLSFRLLKENCLKPIPFPLEELQNQTFHGWFEEVMTREYRMTQNEVQELVFYLKMEKTH